MSNHSGRHGPGQPGPHGSGRPGPHGSGKPDGETARRLRDVLSQEARAIQPSGAGLARIQAKIQAGRSRRNWLRPLAVAATALATAAIVAIVVVVVPSNDNGGGGQLAGSPTGSASTEPSSPSPTPSPSDSASPVGEPRDVTIYYVGKEKDPRQLLYAETVSRPTPAGKALIADAVQAMLTTPPSDPDYTSYWPTGTTIRGVSTHDEGASAIVDLSADALHVGPAAEGLGPISAQQLFQTVQAAAPKVASVELRINGAKVDSLWGSPITNPITTPEFPGAVFAHVWITHPANGATVPTTFKFGGLASVWEANVSWEIVDSTGTVVDKGFTMASIGAPEQGTWEVSVTLKPGTYTIRAFEGSAENGLPTYVDTKQVTVQ